MRDYGVKSDAVVSITEHPDYKSNGAADEFAGLPAGIPNMPAELSQIAKDEWVSVSVNLNKAGLLRLVDKAVLRVYCDTYALYVDAQRKVAEFGEYQNTPNGYQQLAPWAVARARHGKNLAALWDRLFLNPKSRQSVKFENPYQAQLDL